MRDFFTLGPTPSDEPCACVGESDYAERAGAECRRFINLLRKTFGPEPDGARLATKWFDHDFGRYCEVVCYFNPEIPESVEYALRCDNETPTTWERGERGNRMTDAMRCDNCGTTWTEEELDPIRDFWSRVEPGGVIPVGQCPDEACCGLCYPPYGYVYDLEHELAALHDILTRLIEWEQMMGGFEASAWSEARRARRRWQRKREPT